MMRSAIALACASLTFGACTRAPVVAAPTAAPGSAAMQRSAQHDYRVVTVVEGLQNPWSIAFLPGGDMLVTEKPGRLRIVRNGALLPDPVAGLPRIRAGGQGGLLDVVPHPSFASNRLIYISYSKPSEDTLQGTTAVARARIEGDRLTDVQEIFEAKVWSRGRGHHGSRLAFDRNGYLFITVGDRQAPPSGDLEKHLAQDLTTHHGKTIRLHDDGRVPADNPESGDVFVTEHGPQGGDEVNVLQAGKNYGWPVIGFGVNYRTGAAIHSGTHRQGMEQPAHVWVPSIGTSGLLIYTGDRFPQWRGNFFAGGMVGEQLTRLTVDGRRVTNVETLVQRMGRIRDVRQGPDGFIYLAIQNDNQRTPILRLEPVQGN